MEISGADAARQMSDVDRAFATPTSQPRHTTAIPYPDETPLGTLGQMRPPQSRINTQESGPHNAAETGNAGRFPAVTIPQKIANQKKPTLIYDWVSPSRMRSTNSDLSDLGNFNRLGLDCISMTGIEQFTEKQLEEIIRATSPKTVVVIDTRQESHGFIKGIPVSWMATDNRNWANVDKAPADILPKEEKKLRKLATNSDGATLHVPYGSTAKGKSEDAPLPIEVQHSRVETEKQLVERMGGIYLRVPVPDHAAPDLTTLGHFTDSVRTLVQDKGLNNLHFVPHCRGGMGRTTLFMSALDMLVNAHQVSLDDIVDRQVKLRRRDEGAITPGKEYKIQFRQEKTGLCRGKVRGATEIDMRSTAYIARSQK